MWFNQFMLPEVKSFCILEEDKSNPNFELTQYRIVEQRGSGRFNVLGAEYYPNKGQSYYSVYWHHQIGASDFVDQAEGLLQSLEQRGAEDRAPFSQFYFVPGHVELDTPRPFDFRNIPPEYQSQSEQFLRMNTGLTDFVYDSKFLEGMNQLEGFRDYHLPCISFIASVSSPELFAEFVIENGLSDVPKDILLSLFQRLRADEPLPA